MEIVCPYCGATVPDRARANETLCCLGCGRRFAIPVAEVVASAAPPGAAEPEGSINDVAPAGLLPRYPTSETSRAENAEGVPETPAPNPVGQPASAVAAFEQALRQLTPRAYVTTAILLANVVVFGIMALWYAHWLDLPASILMKWGANYGPKTMHGEEWRFLTSIFLHAGLAHLFVNMWCLLFLGRFVERLLGHAGFLFVYLLAGLGGSLAMLGWFPAAIGVGASGAVYGVCGAFLGCYLRAPRAIPWEIIQRSYIALVVLMGFDLIHGYLADEGNFTAHLGGMLCGLLGGLVLGRSAKRSAVGNLMRLSSLAVAGSLLLGFTYYFVGEWIASTTKPFAKMNDIVDRELEALMVMEDALKQWEEQERSEAHTAETLRKDVLPRWETIQSLVKARSALSGERWFQLYGEYVDVRLSFCRNLVRVMTADAGRSSRYRGEFDPMDLALLNMVKTELLRQEVDDEAKEGSRLQQWLRFAKKKSVREKDHKGKENRKRQLAVRF